MKYADYIERIEIDSLQSGRKHVAWDPGGQTNVLSGVNGIGESVILNRVIKSLSKGGDFNSYLPKGMYITASPAGAAAIRYDIVRSFGRPSMSLEMVARVDISLTAELDWQLFQLQRKYLDYQVNISSCIIEVLQKEGVDVAVKA